MPKTNKKAVIPKQTKAPVESPIKKNTKQNKVRGTPKISAVHRRTLNNFQYFQQTLGNQKTARMIDLLKKKDEQAGLYLKHEDIWFNKDVRRVNRKGLLTELEHRIKKIGFVTTKGAIDFIHTLIDDPLKRYEFENKDALIEALFQAELLYRPLRGPQLGPRTLGERPDFKGTATKIEMGEGQARRHVISSSSLGWAIEKSLGGPDASEKQAKLQAVNGFLQRHGGEPQDTGNLAKDLAATARQVWEMAHNHVGNLWLGESRFNSVRGFIRTPLRGEQKRLQKIKEKTPNATVGINEVYDNVVKTQGPGMQQAIATKLWESIAKDLQDVLQNQADKEGQIEPDLAINTLYDFERNADLDLPEIDEQTLAQNPHDQGYLTSIIEVYQDLMQAGPTHDVFKADGALDRFLKLDTGLARQMAQKEKGGQDN